MGKFRDIFKGRHGSLAWATLAVLVIFLISWTAGPGNTFFGWIRAGIDIARIDRQIEYYNEQTSEMDSRIRELKYNRDSLEKFAREKFLFSAPGEDIYVVDEAAK